MTLVLASESFKREQAFASATPMAVPILITARGFDFETFVEEADNRA